DVVSDRANVTPGVLDEHYDRRSQRKRMEQRRGFLDNI
ncbi:site-specific integrase, partial [Halorubrum sp. SS7]